MLDATQESNTEQQEEGRFTCSPADISVHSKVDLQDVQVNEETESSSVSFVLNTHEYSHLTLKTWIYKSSNKRHGDRREPTNLTKAI